jgi:penicillin amidase
MTSRTPSDRATLRWLLWPAAVIGGITATATAARRAVRRSLPQTDGRLSLPGLTDAVEVLRDRWGLPHIYARNDDDLFYAQGFVHAQDRLFQMDLYRRLGQGRISEIVGGRGLPYDRFARYLGWPRAAAAMIAAITEESAAVQAAYNAGVNAFIDTQPLPPEFSALAYRPERWTALDTAAWGTVLAWGLSANWETELLRAWLVAEVGPDKAADLTLTAAEDDPTTLPDTAAGRAVAAALADCYRDTMNHLPLGAPLIGRGLGSNNWVVSGKLTDSARPQLANDPHLPPLLPAIWYGCHLRGPAFNAIGFSLPGVPGVVIGHNAHVAWGLTNGFPDIQDIYIERFDPRDPGRYELDGDWQTAEVRQETIRVRGGRDEAITLRTTRHGPVFSDIFDDAAADLAYDWTLFHPGDQLRAVLAMNRAENAAGLRAALRHWVIPGQNVVYADTAGDIGYLLPGRVPVRAKGRGMAPVPGWTRDHDWTGWIPFDELPALENPPEGFIATANNTVAGDSYPHHLSSEWLAAYRVRRIRDLLAGRAPLSLDDHGRIQTDTVSLMSRRFLGAVLPLIGDAALHDPDAAWALRTLALWDGNMLAGHVAPSLCFAWQVHFTRAALTQAVGPETAERLLDQGEDVGFPLLPFHEMAHELGLIWLEEGCPGWAGDVRPLVGRTLDEALAALRRAYGADPTRWVWGRLHQLQLEHQMAQLPGVGRLWKTTRRPMGGDGFTVNQVEIPPHFPPQPVSIIASCRLIMDVGDWDACRAALPGGQSGHPLSAHYLDLLDGWVAGEYFPLLFSRPAIERETAGWLILSPAG